MDLRSDAFTHGSPIPARHSCDGADVSPPLSWSGVPAGARSLALLVDDPDAPAGTWVHWLLWDLPPTLERLPENAGRAPGAGGGVDGANSWGTVGWRGPCPPFGTHRYHFRLFALDAPLGLDPGATAEAFRGAVGNHVLAEADLVGLYERTR